MLRAKIMLFGKQFKLPKNFAKQDLIFPGILAIATLVLWWPTRTLPYWWDSAGYIMHAARFYVDTNFSSFILPSDSVITAFAHPPVFPFLLAVAWKIFGESLLVSHVFYLFFVLLAVWATYLLGRHVGELASLHTKIGSFYTHGIGIFAALLLLATPVFLAQVGIIYIEIPTAAFAALAAYFFLKRNILWYVLAASFMLAMKETSAVVIAAFVFVLVVQCITMLFREKQRVFLLRTCLKNIGIVAAPLLILAGWFWWHWAATGWLFYLPYYASGFEGRLASFSFGKFTLVLEFFFFSQSRWIITAFLLLSGFVFVSRGQLGKVIPAAARQAVLLLAVVSLAVPLLFGKTEFLSRYIVFGLPFFYVLGSVFFGMLLRQKKIVWGVGLLGLLYMFSLGWNGGFRVSTWHFPPLEENLEYLDVIRVGKETAAFIEANYPDAVVYTAFPSDYMLAEPFQGYVSRPIAVRDCASYREGDRIDLIVFHLLSPPQIQCRDLIQQLKFNPIEGFAHNGKWMQLYASEEQ